MQDWNYRYASCNEVTIELSNNKDQPASQIPNFWNNNRESMLSYAEAVHIGVRGIVTERATGWPIWAEVRIEGNSHPVFTDADVGDYHRMLLPGTYNLIFDAPGYAQLLIENVTVTDGPATRVDVELVSVDLDDDGDVDLADFGEFVVWWLETGCCECGGADFTGDGNVGPDDLGALAQNWLMGVE
jgi:carboxypeptidase D